MTSAGLSVAACEPPGSACLHNIKDFGNSQEWTPELCRVALRCDVQSLEDVAYVIGMVIMPFLPSISYG